MENNEIKELEILEKYLSQEELKDIAKSVAYKYFERNLGKENPYAKSNAEFYIKQGAYQAVVEHAFENSINFKELSDDLEKKVKALIRTTQKYQLPKTFDDIFSEEIENHRSEIKNKLEELTKNFLNKNESGSVYTTFQEHLGYALGEMVSDIFINHFKNKENGKNSEF